jgi:tight adherence protein B
MLLAASLEAGYGVLQGLETIVREAPSPTAEEFGRTLAEIRLGVPMHEALDSMTDRIGGEDFRWVIVAMNIQREVGGNLVEILGTVADTIRERGRLRRTVKALSAEGRLSAVILTVMPFVLSAYLALVNPKYIGTLFSATAGIVFVGIALFLMCVGVVWMRKIVRIEV